MIIQVLYADRDYITGNIENYEHVANVEAPELSSVDGALEFAFRRLQNLNGSWSLGPNLDGYDNPDYDPSVTVLKPLNHDAGGRIWGHRSCSVFDRMIIDGIIYEVAHLGFKVVEA
jgi:hypothetical protein